MILALAIVSNIGSRTNLMKPIWAVGFVTFSRSMNGATGRPSSFSLSDCNIRHAMHPHEINNTWLAGVVVRASDLRSTGREFDFRPCTFGLVLGLVTVRLWAGKPCRYVSSHLDKLSLRVGKSSTGLGLALRRGVFTCVEWQAGVTPYDEWHPVALRCY